VVFFFGKNFFGVWPAPFFPRITDFLAVAFFFGKAFFVFLVLTAALFIFKKFFGALFGFHVDFFPALTGFLAVVFFFGKNFFGVWPAPFFPTIIDFFAAKAFALDSLHAFWYCGG